MGRSEARGRLKRTKVYGRNFEKIIKEKGKRGSKLVPQKLGRKLFPL